MSKSRPSGSPATDTGDRTAVSRWRPLTALLSAYVLTWTGTRLASIAVPWFVLTTTGSALQTGAVVFAQMGPYVVSQALSGPIIDRVGPKRISVTCDVIQAVALVTVPVLFALDALSLPIMMGLLALVGAADGPANAAKSVFIPEVARAAGVPLERVTGLAGTVERTASTVGPAIGGVVVGAWGGATALAVTASLAALSALVIVFAMPATKRKEQEGGEGYVAELKQGADFIRNESLLRSIYLMVAMTNLLDNAVFSVMLPVWATESGHGPEVIGLLASVMSATSIVSSLLAAAYGHRLPRRLVYLVGFIVGGAPRFIVLAFHVPLGLVVAVYAVAGLGSGFLNPIIGAIQFERIPEEMLGRVRSLGVSFAWVGIPFGGLAGGALITALGIAPALLVSAGAYLLTTMLPALRPEWAAMDKERTARES